MGSAKLVTKEEMTEILDRHISKRRYAGIKREKLVGKFAKYYIKPEKDIRVGDIRVGDDETNQFAGIKRCKTIVLNECLGDKIVRVLLLFKIGEYGVSRTNTFYICKKYADEMVSLGIIFYDNGDYIAGRKFQIVTEGDGSLIKDYWD